MRVKLIGVGAAGNKAAIEAVDKKVLAQNNVLLVNSTLRDIPPEYKGDKYQYSKAYGGCGKERKIAKDLCMSDLKDGSIPINAFLGYDTPEQAELVIIVTSTEGGTGSGSSTVLARYISGMLGINVHVFGFIGFKSDVRGLKNTLEWFKELSEDYAVECIDNSKFLPECRDNKMKAEKAANDEFCKKIGMLIGNPIRDSEHNIDPTDLLKVSAQTTGFMCIESAQFEKIKNREQFEQVVINMIDNSKSLDIGKISSSRVAVIINISEASTDYISYEDIIDERYGSPYEVFLHIQHESDMPEFITVIAGGIKMPIEEVEQIHNEYKRRMDRVDKDDDTFFAAAQGLEMEDDDKFSMKDKKKTMSAEEFFGGGDEKKEDKPGFKSTVTRLKSVPADEY